MARARSSKPIPPPPAKLTREARVEQLLAEGHRTNAVCRLAAAEFEVSEDTIKGDVAAIRDRWAAESAASASVDAWLSAQLGLGGPAPAADGGGGGEGT